MFCQKETDFKQLSLCQFSCMCNFHHQKLEYNPKLNVNHHRNSFTKYYISCRKNVIQMKIKYYFFFFKCVQVFILQMLSKRLSFPFAKQVIFAGVLLTVFFLFKFAIWFSIGLNLYNMNIIYMYVIYYHLPYLQNTYIFCII